jgi:uncharacterized protein YggE
VAPITQALADSDITQDNSVSYNLEDMTDAKNKAIEDAYKHARESAETIARAAGRSLGELSYATVDIIENIRPVAMRAMAMKTDAAAPAPTEEFSPQTVQVNAHVNAVFSLR